MDVSIVTIAHILTLSPWEGSLVGSDGAFAIATSVYVSYTYLIAGTLQHPYRTGHLVVTVAFDTAAGVALALELWLPALAFFLAFTVSEDE